MAHSVQITPQSPSLLPIKTASCNIFTYQAVSLSHSNPSNMETQKSHLTMIMPFLMLLLLLLIVGNCATSITEAPSPQPQSANTTAGRGHLPLYGTIEGSLKPQECGPRCTDRCSRTQYRKPCLFFCNKCCAKCLCVPPGYYGNKQFCPCYNDWKTKRGGPKCP